MFFTSLKSFQSLHPTLHSLSLFKIKQTKKKTPHKYAKPNQTNKRPVRYKVPRQTVKFPLCRSTTPGHEACLVVWLIYPVTLPLSLIGKYQLKRALG